MAKLEHQRGDGKVEDIETFGRHPNGNGHVRPLDVPLREAENQSAAARVEDIEMSRHLRVRGERIAACAEEINLILEKYRCGLSPVVLIAGGQIQMRCEVESM